MNESLSVEEKLTESFKQLVMKEPVEKITIKEITDGAGVIRTTFYYHFQDKYELVERIIRQNLVSPIMDLLNESKISTGMLEKALLEIFQRLDAERAFYKRLAKMEGQNSFEELLEQSISEGLPELIQLLESKEGSAIKKRFPWLTEKFVADYYAKTISCILITFLNTDPPAKPEEAQTVFDYVIRHTLNETVLEWCLK